MSYFYTCTCTSSIVNYPRLRIIAKKRDLVPLTRSQDRHLPLSPLSEKEMLEELKLFVENLTCDCSFITHHTISGVNLSGPDFLSRKNKIVAALEHQIRHGDLDRMAAFRRNKRTL